MKSVIKLNQKITTKENFSNLLNIWKFKDEKIVFTSGYFDSLKLEDIEFLSQTADQGTKLIIGLMSDKSAGGNTDENTRAHIVASLFYVDAVIIVDEEAVEELISFVTPDILIEQ